MSNIKEEHGKPRLHVSINLLFFVAVVRTRPRGIPKINSWFSFSLYGYGAPLGCPSGRRNSAVILLLNKKQILIGGKQLFRRDWLKKGIVPIKVLLDETGNLLTLLQTFAGVLQKKIQIPSYARCF